MGPFGPDGWQPVCGPDATAAGLRSTCEEALALGDQEERLIAALLTLASGEGGVEEWEPFDLAEITGRVVAARREDAGQRGIEVSTALSAAPATGPCGFGVLNLP